MDLIILNDGLYQLLPVTKKIMEGIVLTADINCFDLLNHVGIAACPKNAVQKIKSIPNIIQLEKNGGDGVVREFIDLILK